MVRADFVVPPGEGPLDLPAIALGPLESRKLVGKQASELDAIDLDTRRPVRLADFRGKVVLLDFWAYWCGVCIGNMPYLMELDRKFAGRPLVILGPTDARLFSLTRTASRGRTYRALFVVRDDVHILCVRGPGEKAVKPKDIHE